MKEERKIQKTGISSYTVSLPKSWIVKNSIVPGDNVTIYEEENSLRILKGKAKASLKEATINIENFTNEVEVIRKFISHYLDGAGKVTVQFDKPITGQYMKEIINQVKKLIGFEILEQSDTQLVFQDYFTPEALSIKKAVKRAFSISKLVMEESKKAGPDFESIGMWEDEVNKLNLLVKRQISFAMHDSIVLKELDISLREAQNALAVMASIEKITDLLVENARCPQRMKTYCDELLIAYEAAFNSIQKKDFALANSSIERTEKLREKLLAEEGDLLLLNLFTISRYIEEIAETGLNII
jgi:phosphate uptake regulator